MLNILWRNTDRIIGFGSVSSITFVRLLQLASKRLSQATHALPFTLYKGHCRA